MARRRHYAKYPFLSIIKIINHKLKIKIKIKNTILVIYYYLHTYNLAMKRHVEYTPSISDGRSSPPPRFVFFESFGPSKRHPNATIRKRCYSIVDQRKTKRVIRIKNIFNLYKKLKNIII
jgi:hypothetical protein